ncbi:MAG: hypothetical protein ACFFCI_17865 [Promethearchaeota archaeon]
MFTTRSPFSNNLNEYHFHFKLKKIKKGANEFKINEYITLRLENNKTQVYVNEKYFRQCIRLFLNIPVNQPEVYENVVSIDSAADINKDLSLWQNQVVKGAGAVSVHEVKHTITPEEEFRGHCSNLQAWAESNYDTRLLYRNLAFPLLKELSELGDPIAKNRFKEEIALRLEAGEINVFEYLRKNGYLTHFEADELDLIIENIKDPISKLFIKTFSKESRFNDIYKQYIRDIHGFILEDQGILICSYNTKESALKKIGKKSLSFFNQYYPKKSIYEEIEYQLVGGNRFLDFDIPSKSNQKIVYSLNHIKFAREALNHNPDIMISIPKQEGSLRISSKTEGAKLYILPTKLY